MPAHPFAAHKATAGLIVAEGDLDAVHGDVLVDDGQDHRNQKQHIKLPVFQNPAAQGLTLGSDQARRGRGLCFTHAGRPPLGINFGKTRRVHRLSGEPQRPAGSPTCTDCCEKRFVKRYIIEHH